MYLSLQRTLLTSLLAACVLPAYGVTPIDSIVWTSTNTPEGLYNYTTDPAPGGSISASGAPGGQYTFNFGHGTQNDKTLVSFSSGGKTNQIINLADRVNFIREDNPNVSGVRELIWYDADYNQSTGIIDVTASRINDMEATLLGPKISHGTDNAFANVAGANPNNTERIDYVFSTEMVAQDLSILEPSYGGNFDDQLDFGFTIIERGGNDTFQIAPILEVGDVGTPQQGLPTKFGELITVTPGDWGAGLLATDTIVVRGEPEVVGTELQPSAWVTGQSLAGVFVSLRDLGLEVGDAFRGYALFGGDVDPGVDYSTDPVLYSNRLLDTANDSVFPKNTDEGAGGGLDLVSGGVVFDSEGVPTTGFITETVIPSPVIPFGVNPLWGLMLGGVYFWRRLKKRTAEAENAAA